MNFRWKESCDVPDSGTMVVPLCLCGSPVRIWCSFSPQLCKRKRYCGFILASVRFEDLFQSHKESASGDATVRLSGRYICRGRRRSGLMKGLAQNSSIQLSLFIKRYFSWIRFGRKAGPEIVSNPQDYCCSKTVTYYRLATLQLSSGCEVMYLLDLLVTIENTARIPLPTGR